MEKDAFKFSGSAAANYDQYLGPVLFEPYATELVSRIKSPEKAVSVLEIACGTGRVTQHLRRLFQFPAKLTASDLSADMLAVAQSKQDDDAIELRVEDAQNLSFPDNSFDLVVMQFGLMFLPDKKKGLSEIFRVLKPGGRFIITTWERSENVPLINLVFRENILPNFKPEDTGRLLVPFSLHDPTVLIGWAQETGFTDVNVDKVRLPSGAASPEHVVNAFFRKHSLGQELLAADAGQYEYVAQKMQKAIKAKFGDIVVAQLTAFFLTGEKP